MSRRTSRSADPKRNSASAFAISVLPGARRPDEEEHTERPSGIGDARLDHRDALDDAVDGLRLLENSSAKNARTSSSGSGAAASSSARGSPELAASVASTSGPSKRLGTVLGGLGGGREEEPQKVSRRRDARQKLLGELERLRERLVVGFDVEWVVLERMPRDCDRVGLVEWPHAYDFEGALHPWPRGDEELRCGRSHLGDDRDRTRLDVGQQCVEQTLRAAGVLPGEERLLQLRDDPDHALSGDRRHERLDATLELADVHGAGIELGRGRLEHDRVSSIQSSAARVSAVFPTPCSPTSSTERGGFCSSAATTISTSSRRRPARSAGGSSNGRSQMRPTFCRSPVAPGLEARSELGSELTFEAVDERLETSAFSSETLSNVLESTSSPLPMRSLTNSAMTSSRIDSSAGRMARSTGVRRVPRATEKEPVLALGRAHGIARQPRRPIRPGRRHAPRARRAPSTRPSRRCHDSARRPRRRRCPDPRASRQPSGTRAAPRALRGSCSTTRAPAPAAQRPSERRRPREHLRRSPLLLLSLLKRGARLSQIAETTPIAPMTARTITAVLRISLTVRVPWHPSWGESTRPVYAVLSASGRSRRPPGSGPWPASRTGAHHRAGRRTVLSRPE